ncbi:hypothetical protein [Thermogemmatispora tikiterensis]|uniref:KOW domain-containing protein n=1 Tax=Thermogemmatispora tikiterensis TaxID=1825093 RepID=A0A328VHQ8_9CHLR|nr:hypothetical protein [Thermogemmatispora tikiterensis]RAQ97488.1 hypothetical protein A4R35_18270 [Thermogemmatispora tikiterensis]
MPIPLVNPARRRTCRRRTPRYEEIVARARRMLCGHLIEIPEDLLLPDRRRFPPAPQRKGARGVVASISEEGSVCVVLEGEQRRYFGVTLILERARIVS